MRSGISALAQFETPVRAAERGTLQIMVEKTNEQRERAQFRRLREGVLPEVKVSFNSSVLLNESANKETKVGGTCQPRQSLNSSAIRYYEKSGLLTASYRIGGQRGYSNEAVHRFPRIHSLTFRTPQCLAAVGLDTYLAKGHLGDLRPAHSPGVGSGWWK